MSGRQMRARLDKLAETLGLAGEQGPVCRFHGTACVMGARWPLERPADPMDDLRDLIIEAHEAMGSPCDPHPRDLWRTDRHELVPLSELAEQAAELELLLAEARAENEETIARLRGE
ncbi:hypothetical protein [Streptomyces sp. NPDC006784]|uniref:hypothetical protein n=1 Tax=Streptomyces sp. NPDC006784 TaxID=3364764 RepID=UPI0036987528